MKKKNFVLITLTFFIGISFTVAFYFFSINIEEETILVNYKNSNFNKSKKTLFIGVISRYPPNIIYRGYQPIMDYLSSNTNYNFEIKFSDNYEQAIQKLITGEVVASFIGSYIYIQAHKEYGIIPILKPLNENYEPFSRSVLFTNENSNIYKIDDLKGKKLALPSSQSLSSNWLLKYELKRNKIKESDLEIITNFPHHQSVIYNVLNKRYDAGVTREYLLKKLNTNSTRIILYSDPFPTAPLVVTKNYPKEIIKEIKNAFLKLNPQNPDLLNLTKDFDNEFIHGFVEATDKEYDIVRRISK
ncbi:MAG: phosphate/phosphite/phosphonate ABC transporter substrate-binding protein [Melioribacteraceae bacterium]|nr:phosphate/phosphite/phosphonate ABC transporter substrate-binding protein [Melioribacteraceae bacterium]